MFRELCLAARHLLKSPGFTVLTVVTLGLGIGATTSLFSVVNAVLLRSLPYADPSRLVRISQDLHRPGQEQVGASAPEFRDLRARTRSFREIAGFTWQGMNLTGVEVPERLVGARVSANLFSLLGVAPVGGRSFRADEDQPGGPAVVIVSAPFAQRRFGGGTDLLNRTLTLDGRTHAVIGVMPADFEFPFRGIDLWMPLGLDAEAFAEDQRSARFLELIARLRSGVAMATAQEELNVIAAQFATEHRGDYPAGLGLRMMSEHERTIGGVRAVLWVLSVAVMGVMVIACANTANLLLVRASGRLGDVAVRAALGANRWRIVRWLFAESLLLALGGAALGWVLAGWGVEGLTVFVAEQLPRVHEIRMDGAVLAFCAGAAVVSAVVFSLAPASRCWRVDLQVVLRQDSRQAGVGRDGARARGFLVVTELVLTMMLLVMAGLLYRSFREVQRVNPGFDADGLLSVRIVLPWEKYPEGSHRRAFFQRLVERVNFLPGVSEAAVVTALPLADITFDRAFTVEGRPDLGDLPEGSLPTADYVAVSTNYFGVMGIPLLRGRVLNGADEGGIPGVVINQALADRFLGGTEPLGRRIKLGGRDSPFPWMTVVGVTGNVRHRGLEIATRPELHVPYLQPRTPGGAVNAMFLVVRTAADVETVVPAIRREVMTIDPDLPLVNIETMRKRLDETLAMRRFAMFVLTVFAGVAVVLAVIGLYGVMAWTVSQRTREIGLRIALGAGRKDVLSLVVRQGMAWIALGIALGAGGAFATTGLLRRFLFGITPADPVTFGATAVLLAGIALVACYVPVRRAARVDPMVCLRGG